MLKSVSVGTQKEYLLGTRTLKPRDWMSRGTK